MILVSRVCTCSQLGSGDGDETSVLPVKNIGFVATQAGKTASAIGAPLAPTEVLAPEAIRTLPHVATELSRGICPRREGASR